MGYRLVFAQFQGYDDEGYLLVTVQQFLQGKPIYDDIYTQYGPAYYLWQQLLHTAIGIPVTHDATRILTLVMWLSCAVLLGVPVWLLTRRPLMTAIGIATAFFHLTQLTYEPGHPQELCLLVVTCAIAVAAWPLVVNGRLGIPAAITAGALVALTALSKVNVGAFLVGAMTLGLVTSLRRCPGRTTLIAALAAAAVAGIPALMRIDLLRSDVAAWIVVVWSGLLAALVAACDDLGDGALTIRELIAYAAGTAIVSVAVLLVIIVNGTSLHGLFDGLLVWPLRFPRVFWRPLPVPLVAAAVAPISLLICVYLRRNIIAKQRWMSSVSLAVGQIMFLLSLLKAFGLLLAFATPFVWLAAGEASLDPGERAARRILIFATLFLALQIYPMPEGTQSALGTVLFVPLALVTVADAERALRPNHGLPPKLSSLRQRATLAPFVLLVTIVIGVAVERLYARGVPLSLPGAQAVRAVERDRATYWWLTANLREHCAAFLTAPGLNSLHLWTGIAPVSSLNTTLWPLLLNEEQQSRILAAAAPVERLCVAWNPRRMDVLMNMPNATVRPLLAWLAQEFEPLAAFGDWEFRVRHGSHPPLVYQGRRLDEGHIALDLPPLGTEPIERVAVVDLDVERTLADSASGPGVVVVDEGDRDAQLQQGIAVTLGRRLIIRGVVIPPGSGHSSLVIRLWGHDGQTIAIVPVVTDGSNGWRETSPPPSPD
jgi:hypothetical protein